MHHIMKLEYPYNMDKKKIQADCDKIAAEKCKGKGATGLYYPIRWLNIICDSFAEVYEKINELDKRNYDQLAVGYRVYHDLKPSKKMEELSEKVKNSRENYLKKNKNIHYKGVKSEFIGCKNCGSRICSKYINYNNCPICKADLRPQSTLDNIKAAYDAYKKYEKQLKEEEKKLQAKNKAKSELRWLVKIEFHV